jgi:hypothetical protein
MYYRTNMTPAGATSDMARIVRDTSRPVTPIHMIRRAQRRSARNSAAMDQKPS